jgi:outer membrane immunogenic protein
MKKLLLSTAVLALTAGAALAADLPTRKAAPYIPPPPPPPMWTGFYAGLNAGYGFGTNSQTNSAYYQYGSLNHYTGTDPLVGGALGTNTFAMTQSGFIGGGQLGYNYQWGSNVVIGIEADMQGAGIQGRSNSVGTAGVAGNYGPYNTESGLPYGNYSQSGPAGQTINAGVNWMGTVRGRLGYLWTPTMLVYATGGLTYGGAYANVTAASVQSGAANSGRTDGNGNPINYITNQTFFGGGQRSSTLVGWNVGGGLEWMFMPNWSVKAEAIYWNMGNMNVGTAAFASGANFASSDGLNHYASGFYSLNPSQIVGGSRVNFQGVIARVGVNYHFNWGAAAPIVAKY